MMNVIQEARAKLDKLYAPQNDLWRQIDSIRQAQIEARERQQTIDTASDMMHEVYISLDAQESEHGWIEDGIWVDMYRFAPKGAKPAYIVYVNGVAYYTILKAAEAIADIWHNS